MSNSRKGTPPHVRCLLWGRAAGRCQFAGCNRDLTMNPNTKEAVGIAEEAHIIAYTPNGPRGDKELSEKYCRDIDNLMLLCHDCHKPIDANPAKYSIKLLREMKERHESRIRLVSGISDEKSSNLLIYDANVGSATAHIDARECIDAMFPEWYPIQRDGIRLGLCNSVQTDDGQLFWELESAQLRKAFAAKVLPVLSDSSEQPNTCVFALAPQPLLILLGSLLTDIHNVSIYQLHREPRTWKWLSVADEISYILSEPTLKTNNPALVLSLSANISDNRIQSVMPDASIWRISIPAPNQDFLKNAQMLSNFRVVVRTALNAIKASHPYATSISIFPAMPVAAAIELGRVRQPKADLPFTIWDENRKLGGFHKTITIGV